jgi:aminoglycoside 6-adenylyltransferase
MGVRAADATSSASAARLEIVDYEAVLSSLTTWAEGDPNVRALVLTGSGAVHEEHGLSDRDIEIFAIEVEPLIADESWWSRLGDVLVVERLENGEGDATRLVYYVGGKLDFTLMPASALTETAYERPVRVLLDKDGGATSLRVESRRWQMPSESEFMTSVHWAYAAALMCARALVRDELWTVKIRDQDFKAELLQMIEWDHRARHGPEYDTRYQGTRMNQWMDRNVRDELFGCWGHFDAGDSAIALRNGVRLFALVAARTAAAWNLGTFDHDRVEAEIEAVLAHSEV